ncbi:MAG: hypothetical protein NVSMB21_24540 [Vulcanimicrobiaceae bacterium]
MTERIDRRPERGERVGDGGIGVETARAADVDGHVASEERVAADLHPTQDAERLAEAAARAAVAPPVSEVAPPAPPQAPVRSIKTTLSTAEKAKAKPESFMRPAPATPYRPAAQKVQNGTNEELIPGLKSLMGRFGRKKVEPPAEPIATVDGSSIADRIARDFGLLGAAPDEERP